MDTATVDTLAAKFMTFLQTNSAPEGLFASDVFRDYTPPQWRLQAEGIEDVVAMRKAGHPALGRVSRHRVDPTPTGFVIEFEEEWEGGGQQFYAREKARLDVADDLVTAVAVYCTGNWDEAQRRRHGRPCHCCGPEAARSATTPPRPMALTRFAGKAGK
jgi:hypothetical protein